MISFAAICSLDGFVADRDGNWDWSMPDEEVHAFVNDRERELDAYLYGRRLYEVLSAWETMDEPEPLLQDYAAIWRSKDKIVYSRTLESVSTERTRLEREFDAEAVRAMPGRLGLGGPTLAAAAFAADLVDEVELYVAPVVVGGGKPVFPGDQRVDLRLVGEHRFENGTVHLHYAR